MGEDAGRDLLDRQGTGRLRAGRTICGERQNYDEKGAYENAHQPSQVRTRV